MDLFKSLRLYILIIPYIFLIASSSIHGSQPAQVASIKSQETSRQERTRISKLLNEHMDEILLTHPKEYTWLPGYYIKTGSDRLKGAQILSACIKQYNLKYVTVPEKWTHPISKQQLRQSIYRYEKYHDDPYVVVAKKLTALDHGEMNVDQAQDVYCLLTHAQHEGCYYSDTHVGNILICFDGTVGFIDTELRGFRPTTPLYGLKTLMSYAKKSPDARAFLQDKLDQHTQLEESQYNFKG